MAFHIASEKEIKEGKVTDVYFSRTMEILEEKKIDSWVRAEFIAKSFPHDWEWAVLAGIEECAQLLEGLGINVRAMEEGTIFRPLQPVMELEGNYKDFGKYETALLGLICQASGIATKAARCKKLAGQKWVISFGARRMHPAISPMIERSAFIGGCDGVAAETSAKLIGENPMGTMPHALVLIMGDTVEATRAFHEVVQKGIGRISLIDTFNDEKFEAIRVAEALRDDLLGVRLDTPSSRRGNFFEILREVRWELDLRGFKGVKIFVSGGIDENDISKYSPFVDAFGVGTAISNAPVIDFSMDIVEINGKPIAKRGKMSGGKKVLRCQRCYNDHVLPIKANVEECTCGGKYIEILSPFFKEGKICKELPKPQRIREYVLEQLSHFSI